MTEQELSQPEPELTPFLAGIWGHAFDLFFCDRDDPDRMKTLEVNYPPNLSAILFFS